MSINSELIRRKEELNNKLEQYADDALLQDKKTKILSKDMDTIQSALLYILHKFQLPASRVYAFYSIDDLLERIMGSVGVMYRHSDDLKTEVKERTQYILAFDQDDHPYVILPTRIGYRRYDPSTGKSGFCTRAFVQSLKDSCYVFTQPMKQYSSVLLTFVVSILRYLTNRDVIRLLGSSAIMTALGLAFPKINQWIYNVYLKDPASNMYMFRLMLSLFISLHIVQTVISVLKSHLLSDIRNRISIRIQGIVMAKILDLPRAFFADNSSGKISKRITQCNNLTSTIVNIFMDILLNFSFSGAYLVQMHGISKELFVPAVFFVIIKLAFSIFTSFWDMVISRKSIALSMESDSFFYSAIKGILKIKSMGAEKAIYSKWADMYREILHNNYNRPFILRYSGLITSAISTFMTVTLMGSTVLNGLTREQYMVFSSSLGMMLSVINTLTGTMGSAFKMSTMAQSIAPIFQYEPQQKGQLEYVRSLRGNIRAENIHFSYDADMIGCLKGVSLNIKAGEKIAIVGESGCGKSTFLKIIMGMETPHSGTVYFDDKDIAHLNQRSLRQKIGSVFQFSKLFPGTIYENVTFGCFEEVDEDRVWDALEKACIADYIRQQPLGLNTDVSQSNSSGFSGGQRQRILIARALIRNPKVLVLDEATSALDNITQKQVLDNILKLNSTVLMVAHRLSTVMHFDRIVMFKNGVIEEEGTYDELMKKNGAFAELVNKQLIEEEKLK